MHLGPVTVEEFFGATLLNTVQHSAIAQCAFAHHAFHRAIIGERSGKDPLEALELAAREAARVAAEAFCTITGVDAENLTSADNPHPEWTAGPNEDPADPNVALDDDERLPWPDPQKASALWQRIGSNFIVGQRYFLGRPLTIGDLKDTVVNGYQRHRHAAAMELALSDWQTRLINTKARTLPYSSPC